MSRKVTEAFFPWEEWWEWLRKPCLDESLILCEFIPFLTIFSFLWSILLVLKMRVLEAFFFFKLCPALFHFSLLLLCCALILLVKHIQWIMFTCLYVCSVCKSIPLWVYQYTVIYTIASSLSCTETAVYQHDNHLQEPCRRKVFSCLKGNMCLALIKPHISSLTK